MDIDYAQIAATYDDWRSYSREVVEALCGHGNIRKGSEVLDIGCGTGTLALQIARQTGARVTGIDRSIQMLAKASARTVTPVCATIDRGDLPFRDGVFDAVIGTYVIHHVSDLPRLFSECFRVIGRGVIMILTSSHRQIDDYHPVLKEFFPGFTELEKNRFPDAGAVVSHLERAGFHGIGHRELFIERIPIDRTYLEKVKGKFVSTYHLLPGDEFDSGVEKLTRFVESPAVPASQEWRATLFTAGKNGG